VLWTRSSPLLAWKGALFSGILRDTMSRENVAGVHEAIDAFNRRDLDGYLALMDPACEFTPYEVMVQGGTPYTGHEGVRRWWAESFAVLPDLNAEIDEVKAGGDFTFVSGRLRGSGAGSGAPIEREMWLAIEWRDGREVWWASFESRAEALEAAGLSE
jgi:ketosteroid isomerase-like protein